MLATFVETCRRFASRPAFVIQGETHTYAALWQRVSAIAEALRDLPKDERFVGVVAHDHLDSYAAIYAILLSGRCYVPLNPAHPPQRNASIVAQVPLRTVFSSSAEAVELVLGSRVDSVLTSDLCRAGASPDMPAPESSSLAYLLFTSGSTGVPKGVPITHANVSAFLGAFFASGGEMREDDRVLQMFDLTFDFSVVAYMAPLCRGACVYTVPPDVIKFTFIAALLEEAQLTQLPLVPSVLNHLRPYLPDLSLPAVRHTFFCGEALHSDLLIAWRQAAKGSRLTNYYGPTEATVFATYYHWDSQREGSPRAHNGIVSIGTPMRDMDAIVVDDEGRVLGAGGKGELCLGGPQLTPGYFNDHARDARAFFVSSGRRYYRTGDLATHELDQTFTFAGRLDHQVKVQGYRVELAEIEHHARELVHPSEAVVVDVAIGGSTSLHLFLESFAGDSRRLLADLKTRVPGYMVPATVTVLPALPLNANGKVDRLRLRELARAESKRAHG